LPPIAAASEPDTEDTAAWRAHIDARNREVTARMSANAGSHPSEVIANDLSRSRLYEVKPASFSPRHGKHAILYIHGGAFIYGGGYAAALSAMSIASLTQCVTFSEATWRADDLAGNARFRAVGQTSNLSMRVAAMTQI
jgi:acetyl esterase/lipase